MSECCGESRAKTVLLYACSGGANVGEIADRAARQLMAEGAGIMWCLAGLGGNVDLIVQKAKDADQNIILDGCPVECARKCFENAGVTNYVHIKITDLGIDKAKGVAITEDQVAAAVAKAKDVLSDT